MKIIFCADPIDIENPDALYIDEIAAATHAGFEFELINHNALAIDNNAARAVRDIPVHDAVELAVYRGWMLRATQYRLLYDALLSRGLRLINTADAYRHCHHLPEALGLIEAQTPRTVWMPSDGKRLSYPAIMQLLERFGGQPLILKDYVKSEKHHWNDACYISSAADEAAVRRTVNNFLKIRDGDIEGGLVFREYVDFERLQEHPKSGMPLSKEYRIFYWRHQPILTVRYWDVVDYDDDDLPPIEQFADIARQIRSNFFTMDVGKRSDGEWMIIELGDAQVAGIPTDADLDGFYKALASS